MDHILNPYNEPPPPTKHNANEYSYGSQKSQLLNSAFVKYTEDTQRRYTLTTVWSLLRIPKILLLSILLAIHTISYILSLQGGDLSFIHKQLGTMGAQLLVSILSLTWVTILLYTRRMRKRTRGSIALMIILIFISLYIYDHGERFEHHGFYNLLVFLAIYIPLNTAIAILYFLSCKLDNFPIYFTIGSAVCAISTCVSLFYYRRVFDQGMLGKFQYLDGECQWEGYNIPFVDLLPAGAQNFWAGPMSCSAEKHKITADIDEFGVLRAKCNSADSMFVDVLPETRDWALKDKEMWSVLNHRVLDKIEKHAYPGSNSPFRLNTTTQAVVVRCGPSSKIVTRVSPHPSTLPEYEAPTDDDTRIRKDDKEGDAIFDASDLGYDTITRPNVVFLMLDAVSHRQFHRRLKKSVYELKNTHRPGVSRLQELYRYHSVGISSDNNTKAMYIGEFNPSESNRIPIWGYYRDRGYLTARIESGCDDWAEQYVRHKYSSQGYSVGNRTLDYELLSPFCLPEFYPATGNAFGNFKGPYSIKARCLYGRYVHDWAFDYLNQLRREFRTTSRPYLAMLSLFEGHEGTGEVLWTLDDALSEFIRSMRDSGELKDTILVICADHGLHMGLNFAFLQNGRIENKNPFFAMSVPEWLYQFAEMYQNKYGENISPFSANEQRLTTPFETHYMFRVLADWPKFHTSDWEKSLFMAQKAGRTCDEAKIGSEYCMCKIPRS